VVLKPTPVLPKLPSRFVSKIKRRFEQFIGRGLQIELIYIIKFAAVRGSYERPII